VLKHRTPCAIALALRLTPRKAFGDGGLPPLFPRTSKTILLAEPFISWGFCLCALGHEQRYATKSGRGLPQSRTLARWSYAFKPRKLVVCGNPPRIHVAFIVYEDEEDFKSTHLAIHLSTHPTIRSMRIWIGKRPKIPIVMRRNET
jgi:hypothetical protein